MKLHSHIRIKDIARMAGVSTGTVDRVLHNRGKVSEENLKKVNEVLGKINYKPNLIARSLGKGKKHKISVIIIDPTLDQYWKEVYAGIAQAQEEWDHYGIIIESFFYRHDGPASLDKITSNALLTKPDGIVMAPLFRPQSLPVVNKIEKQGIPIVLFNTNIPEAKRLSFIGQDLFQSGALAGRLMSMGMEPNAKIAILHVGEDPKESVYLQEKENGFREFYDSNHVAPNTIESFMIDLDSAVFKREMIQLLSSGDTQGIFVTTSNGTSMVAEFLSQKKNNSLRLVGYDMLEDNLKYLRKGVITFLINQNPKRQAFLGISHMANHLLFKKNVPTTDLFPLEIITQQNLDSYLASTIH